MWLLLLLLLLLKMLLLSLKQLLRRFVRRDLTFLLLSRRLLFDFGHGRSRRVRRCCRGRFPSGNRGFAGMRKGVVHRQMNIGGRRNAAVATVARGGFLKEKPRNRRMNARKSRSKQDGKVESKGARIVWRAIKERKGLCIRENQEGRRVQLPKKGQKSCKEKGMKGE